MLEQIFSSLAQHKQRALLTGLSIFWGVFILIILVGLGSGFEKGVLGIFDIFSNNAVWINFNKTAQEYKGLSSGRTIRLSYTDVTYLKANIAEIQHISPESNLGRGSFVTHGSNKGWFNVKGVNAEYFHIKKLAPSVGRTLNELDDVMKRKVCFIGKHVAERFFKQEKYAIGECVKIDSDFYTIIGVIESTFSTINESRNIYIPYSTFEINYGLFDQIPVIAVSIKKKSSNHKAIEQKMRNVLSRRLHFSGDDEEVLYYLSLRAQIDVFELLFSTINGFLWFIGISALLSGIISIGNMMFMVVKERSREIGLRKALGAKPSHLLKQFLGESIILTSIAGFCGLIAGMLVLAVLESNVNEGELIETFQINVGIGVIATLLIIISGTLAGFLPAHAAAGVDPIETLRQE